MKRPKVSIVTATLNNLPGLEQTVDSVDSQTFPDVEHVVVDGGSTDGTREWLWTRPHLRSVSEPDSGIAEALNKGLEMASGEWVLVLHSEDTLIDRFSLAVASHVLETSADVVSFHVLFASRSGNRIWKTRGLSFRTNFKTTIPHQGAFCRRSLFERVGQFDNRFRVAMDYEFFLRAYRAGVDVDVVNTVLSRMPATGISSKTDWRSLRQRFEEERLAHRLHHYGPGLRLLYAGYWPLYLTYRKARSLAGD